MCRAGPARVRLRSPVGRCREAVSVRSSGCGWNTGGADESPGKTHANGLELIGVSDGGPMATSAGSPAAGMCRLGYVAWSEFGGFFDSEAELDP